MISTFLIQLVQFIIGLAVLIIIHELGHFLVARLLKVEVEEFGIGFPPRAKKLFVFKGTTFTLNWLPLGGFVSPKGQNDPNIPGGLAAASPWVRLAVMFAGPVMNLLVGVLLAVIFVFSRGEPRPDQVLITAVVADTPALRAGLQANDLIVKVNDTPIDGMDLLRSLTEINLDKPISLTYQRDGQLTTVTLTPRSNHPADQGAMGIVIANPIVKVNLGRATISGFDLVYQNIYSFLTLPVRMFQGQASPEEVRVVGLPGMFRIFQIADTLGFFMLISVSLGIINLLPIPALDGGRILLTLPEIIFRRRLSPKIENAVHLIGLALLLVLMVYINIKDLIDPITLPK